MREDTIGIVTLLSRQHFEKGEYVLHIEVLLHKHSETKAKRRLEKEGYVDHPCLCRTAISPPIFVTYDDNKPFEIRFSISGCLQPRVKLKEGQDVLAFDPKKTECRRTLVLQPVPSHQKCAEIHFEGKTGQKFLHQVLISVPSENAVTTASATTITGAGSLRSTTISTTSGASSSEFASTAGSTSSKSSSVMITSDSVPGETLRTRSSEQDTRTTFTLEESPSEKLLSDNSLQSLAAELGPGDAAQLVVYLGLSWTDHCLSEADNPRNTVRATLTSLKKWHQTVEGSSAKKLSDLLSCLCKIGRNDLKAKWQKLYSEY